MRQRRGPNLSGPGRSAMEPRFVRQCLSLAAAGAITAATAASAGAPDGPIRIVVPLPAGGGVDVVARELAERISVTAGARFAIENRPGAGTIIGTEAVARAAPDGRTLLLV